MDNLIALYQERLGLQGSTFSLIEHEEAMVATVYKITQPNDTNLVLKIYEHPDHYFREVYFLKHFSEAIPVPRLMQVAQPQTGSHGAILMEYLPGKLLEKTDLTQEVAYEIGSLLARIHINHTEGYGDPIQPNNLSSDPRIHFALKFEEGFAECSNHLPKTLLEQCRHYFDTHIDLLLSVDGPCLIHRDFRPGNVIIYDGKLKGIIDWASGRASFAQEDFCPLEHGEWPTCPTTKKSFLTGYASMRPVPEYGAIMPLLRLSRAFATIGFTVKCGIWESSYSRVYQSNRSFLETFF